MQHNLARVWRSRNFDEIVGQELSVRLLKNSLAYNKIFPVYLFSGLRGSGKTSLGRIFAGALNCENLSEFQKNQTISIPCLSCTSCLSMRAGNHPDFIEIDAASHTGVDNVRNIIESASFLPVMGRKKVYLIDEAHMLSKAAFNAFLKILEEPPATVVFLLATTESHKILDTVLSRSFQLFFESIPADILQNHLKRICAAENILCEDAALALIVQQSEGSVRDALTIMERVMLAENAVTYQGAQHALGLMDDGIIIKLFEIMAQGSLANVFEYSAETQLHKYNPQQMWYKMVGVLRTLLWVQSGASQKSSSYVCDVSSLQEQYTLPLVMEFFELLYKAESHFLKTTAQHVVLEGLLCKITQRFGDPQGPKTSESSAGSQRVHVSTTEEKSAVRIEKSAVSHTPHVKKEVAQSQQVAQAPTVPSATGTWQQFLNELEKKNNPLVTSVFRQGVVREHTDVRVVVQFAKKFEFYSEWMRSNEQLWKPVLEQFFGQGIVFAPEFITQEQQTMVQSVPQDVTNKQVASNPSSVRERTPVRVQEPLGARRTSGPGEEYETSQEKIDIKDSEKWPTAHMITQMFPGTIKLHKEHP